MVYPALDSKVKNVTVAYSVEHRAEVGAAYHGCSIRWPPLNFQPALTCLGKACAHTMLGCFCNSVAFAAVFMRLVTILTLTQELLFEQLSQLLVAAVGCQGTQRADTIR